MEKKSSIGSDDSFNTVEEDGENVKNEDLNKEKYLDENYGGAILKRMITQKSKVLVTDVSEHSSLNE